MIAKGREFFLWDFPSQWLNSRKELLSTEVNHTSERKPQGLALHIPGSAHSIHQKKEKKYLNREPIHCF